MITGTTANFGSAIDCVDGNLLLGDYGVTGTVSLEGRAYLLFARSTPVWPDSFAITSVAGTSVCTVIAMPSETQWGIWIYRVRNRRHQR